MESKQPDTEHELDGLNDRVIETPVRLLLVEDDEVDRLAFLRFVTREKLNYVATVASSVRDARAALASASFDIILLDNRLGDGSGFELLDEVREIPVLFVTGANSPDTAVKAMKAGASDYLLKDHDRAYLKLLPIAVERAIRQREELASRRRLEGMLAQAQKMEALGTLAGGVAHEFNNILAIIVSCVELSKMDAAQYPAILENLEEVLKAGRRGKEIIDQILTFNRGRDERRRPVRLGPALEDAVRLIQFTMPSTVTWNVTFSATGTVIAANRTQLQQALGNICKNSWQAMPGGKGRIDLVESSVRLGDGMAAQAGLEPGEYACIAISDTGSGMDAGMIGRVFDPFFTTKSPGQGTGLGLSVVHGIMKAHGGAVTIESARRTGTTVRLYFPLCDEAVDEPVDAALVPQLTGNGRSIALVDDEPALVMVSATVLERAGYRVSGFHRAADLLDAIRADPDSVDAVIADFNMPGMNGLELLENLRLVRGGLPVVLMTGFGNDLMLERARRLGAAEVLHKPVLPRQLVGVLNSLFEDCVVKA